MSNKTLTYGVYLCFVFYLFQVFLFSQILGIIPDENFYTYEAYLMATGKMVPYVDKFTGYAPLSYFIPGFVQKFTGAGLLGPRIVTGVLGLGAVVLAYRMSRTLGGELAGMFAVLFMVFHPRITQLFSTSQPFALANLMQLCAFGVLLLRFSDIKKVIASASFMALAVLTRHTLLLGTTVYFFMLIWMYGLKKFVLALFSFVTVSALLSVVVFRMDFEGAFLPQISSRLPFLLKTDKVIVPSIDNLSFRWMNFFLYVQAFVRHFYFPLILFGGAFLAILCTRTQILKESPHRKIIVCLVIYFVANFLIHSYGAGIKFKNVGEVAYHVYFYFALIVPASLMAARIFNSITLTPAKSMLTGIYITGFLLMPLNFGLGLVNFPLFPSPITRVKEVAQVMKQSISDDKKIFFWGPIVYLLYSGKETYPPLLNGHNLFTVERDTHQVKRFGFYNIEMVQQWLKKDSQWVIIVQGQFGGMNQPSSPAHPGYLLYITIYNALQNYYEPYKTIENVPDGPMTIYRRKGRKAS